MSGHYSGKSPLRRGSQSHSPVSSGTRKGGRSSGVRSAKGREDARSSSGTRSAESPWSGTIFIWGKHPVKEALLNPRRISQKLFIVDNCSPDVLGAYTSCVKRIERPRSVEILRVSRARLDELAGGGVHQGVLLEAQALPFLTLKELLGRRDLPRLIVVLDHIVDPHNLGAIIRSSVAFGAEALVTTIDHSPSFGGIVAKSAAGALEHLDLVRVTNLRNTLLMLQKKGFWCVGLSEEGDADLSCLPGTGPFVLVVGAEGKGLRRLTKETCDVLLRLPTQDFFSTLNASNAAAVGLYILKNRL